MGEYYLRFRGKTIYQNVNISGSAGDTFVYGGSALMDNIDANGTVTLTFYYEDGTTSDSREGGPYQFKFDSKDQNIQYLMYKAVAEKDYTKMHLKINNTSTNEYINIDNMDLYKEGYGLKLEYTPDGDIETTTNEITGAWSERHYEDGKLSSITENNSTIDISREETNDWVNSVTSNNVTQSFKRDEHGNVTELNLSSTIDNNNYIYYYSTSTEYSTNKLYVNSTTDEYGRVTNYTYDYLTGLLASSIFNGVTTNIDYDSLKNITNISHGSKTINYSYSGKLLKSITVDGLTYSFDYNDYKDITTIKIAGNTVLSNTYKDVNTSQYSGLIEQTTYGTDLIRFTYDEEKRINEVFVNNVKQIEYIYDSIGNIAKVIDYKADPNVTYYYNFDEQNRIVNITSSDGNNVTYEYNSDGFLSGKTNINGKVDYNYIPIEALDNPDGYTPIEEPFKNTNQVLREEIFGSFSKKYNYQTNGLKKLESTAIITSVSTITSNYTYDSFQKTVDGENRVYETLRIKELNINKKINGLETSLIKLVYTYYDTGNIQFIERYDEDIFTKCESFDYDIYNQLTYHNIYDGISSNSTYYSYDNRGNILHIMRFIGGILTSSIHLTYESTGWLDKLKTVTVDGVSYNIINNSNIGNPYLYMGYAIYYDQRSITYLEDLDSGDTLTFKYNASGVRTSKTNHLGIVIDYTLDGNKILKESRSDGKVLNYFYDQSGSIIGFKYNNNSYTYIKNLQNDIIGIVDSSGNLIVKYEYDAYGNVLEVMDTSGIGLGNINPFRYKSYYYDVETKFYYLNSRYYDPMIGRFINADDVGMLAYGETNLFRYCENNPIHFIDTNGYIPQSLMLNDGGSNWKNVPPSPESGYIPHKDQKGVRSNIPGQKGYGNLKKGWHAKDGTWWYPDKHRSHGDKHYEEHDSNGDSTGWQIDPKTGKRTKRSETNNHFDSNNLVIPTVITITAVSFIYPSFMAACNNAFNGGRINTGELAKIW